MHFGGESAFSAYFSIGGSSPSFLDDFFFTIRPKFCGEFKKRIFRPFRKSWHGVLGVRKILSQMLKSDVLKFFHRKSWMACGESLVPIEQNNSFS